MNVETVVFWVLFVIWICINLYELYSMTKWQNEKEKDLQKGLDELDELVDEYRVEIVRQKMQELYAPPEHDEVVMTISNEIDRKLASSLSRTKITCEWSFCKHNKSGVCQNDSVELIMDNEENENLSCTKFDYGDVMG